MSYKLKIKGLLYESEIEGTRDWTRTVVRDFDERLFRTRGDYQFIGHEGLYNLLYNHITTDGVCAEFEGRIYYNTGTGWDYEWRGEIKIQDFEFDLLKRTASGQVLDNSWAARFNNSDEQKVFFKSETTSTGATMLSATATQVYMFDPSTGVYDFATRRMYSVFDAFTFLVNYYTDSSVTFTSDYFTTGLGNVYYITTGREIRLTDDSCNPAISFKDLFDEMNKINNLWIMIEGTPDAPVLRIEPFEYVFNNTKLFNIVDPENIKLTTDLEQLYSTIKVGSTAVDYDDTANATYPNAGFVAWNNEEYQGPTTCTFENNSLDLVNSWKIDHNTIEQQYNTVGQDEGDFDDDIFIIEVEQSGGLYNAIKYTSDYEGDYGAQAVYNLTSTNETKLNRWNIALPADVARTLNRNLYASVSTLVVTSFNRKTTYSAPDCGWLLQFNNEVSDEDDIYTPPPASGRGSFQPGYEGWYKFTVYIPVNTSFSAYPYHVQVGIYPSTADALLCQNGEFYIIDTVAGPTPDDLQGSIGVFMPENYVAYIELVNAAGKIRLASNGTAVIESIDAEQKLSGESPLIYIFDAEQFALSRTDFDTLDQGRGFVRILDSNGNKAYDVWAKEVKYNSTTNTVEVGKFIGRTLPLEVCWVLETGYWVDTCYWLDNEYLLDVEILYFIITVKTDNAGVSNNDQFQLPTTGVGYSYYIDWGDGTEEVIVTGSPPTHTYAAAGTYTIKIGNAFPRIYFNDGGDRRKLLTIEQWGDIAWTSMADAFEGCFNVTGNFTDAPDLSGVTDASAMFYRCKLFDSNLSNWDVSTLTTVNGMFGSNSALNATIFNGDITGWDVSNVQFFTQMFVNNDTFNRDISGWDTSSATDMASMFSSADLFNQDISSWDVSNVTDMSSMFADAAAFDQDIGNWTVSSLTDASNFLNNVTLSTANYNALLIGWTGWSGGMATKTVQNGVTFNGGNSTYSLGGDAAAARAWLIGTKGWTITDGGGV